MDVVTLSRIQFALTSGFHYIYPPLSIGLGLMLSIGAYYYLKKQHKAFAHETMKIGFWSASVVLVLQLISADITARGVAFNQPSKLAAMEGIYQTQQATPLTVIGWVDTTNQTVKGIQIPGLLSFLVYRNVETPITGFDQIPPDERPPIGIVFQAYHLMILMWGLMALATIAGFYLWKKKKLEKTKWALWLLIISVIFPQIANQTGWMTAEIGRQPWIVWKLLRTEHGVSATINAHQVLISISMFIVIYTLLLILFLFLLDRKIKHGPVGEEELVYRDVIKQGGTK